jgi:hypothetical protein
VSSGDDHRSTRAILESIEAGMRRIGHTACIDLLQEGHAPSAVPAILGSANLPVTRDLVEFYAWRNGSATGTAARIGDMYFLPGFYVQSLSDAVLDYRTFLRDERWRRGWLPILADGGGDFLVADLSVEGISPIHHFRIEEVEHPVEYSSLRDMLRTIDAAYRSNVMYVAPDGFLDMRDDAYAEVAAALNPEIAWWKS